MPSHKTIADKYLWLLQSHLIQELISIVPFPTEDNLQWIEDNLQWEREQSRLIPGSDDSAVVSVTFCHFDNTTTRLS